MSLSFVQKLTLMKPHQKDLFFLNYEIVKYCVETFLVIP